MQFKITTKSDIHAAAAAAAAELGIPLSEYMRRALIHLVKTKTNPFSEPSGQRLGRPPKAQA